MERDEEGNILSIGLDVVEANRLRSGAGSRAGAAARADECASVHRCAGQPDRFAAAVCPRSAAAFWIAPSGNLRLDFEQTLLSAGINQTVYRVQLRVSAVTQAMLGVPMCRRRWKRSSCWRNG